MTKLHRGAGLHGERGDLFCSYPGHEFADAARDGDAVFVELVLPEHAGENGTPQGLLRCKDGRGGAFVSARTREMGQLEDVQLHVVAPPLVRVSKNRRGTGDNGKLHERCGLGTRVPPRSRQESNLLLRFSPELSQMK